MSDQTGARPRICSCLTDMQPETYLAILRPHYEALVGAVRAAKAFACNVGYAEAARLKEALTGLEAAGIEIEGEGNG